MIVKSVRPLLVWAAVIWGLYGVANVLGLRSDMALLSGTIPTSNMGVGVVLCVVYLGLYLGAVFVAPVLVIAAAIEGGMRKFGIDSLKSGG
jgi:hypothetical protein